MANLNYLLKNFFDLTLKSIEKGKNKGFDLKKKIS